MIIRTSCLVFIHFKVSRVINLIYKISATVISAIVVITGDGNTTNQGNGCESQQANGTCTGCSSLCCSSCCRGCYCLSNHLRSSGAALRCR